MMYAAQRQDGSWTGAVYDEITPRIEAHHAQFEEDLLPVLGLSKSGGTWQAELPSVEDQRGTWSVSRFQMRQALMAMDFLEVADEAIRFTENPLLIGVWEDGLYYHRISPFCAALISSGVVTAEVLDDIFAAAALIEA